MNSIIVGATVPQGIESLEDFVKLKLGDLALTNLPDSKHEAIEIMKYCRQNSIFVILEEIIKRGSYERKRSLNFSKKDFDEIIEAAGKYYLGRYAIGEAGGILYWPKTYTINRRVNSYQNMPKCNNAEEARLAYIDYLKKFIDYERQMVGGGNLFNVESCILFNYQAEAGIDSFCLEMLPGNPDLLLSAIRGNSRTFSKRWGAHIAMEWYGGIRLDALWLKRWKLSLYYAFMGGANFIFPESGHYEYKNGREDNFYEFSDTKMKASRKILREFWRFSKIHSRPDSGPETYIGVILGNNEGYPGIWNPYFWGQYENGKQWEAGPAEAGWTLLDSFYRTQNPFDETLMGEMSFSGNPPMGQFDIVPIESSLDKLEQYKCLVFIGWNNMTEEIYSKLIAYVKSGGHLLMWLPHFNTEKRRNGNIKLFRDGNLKDLFGVEVCGKRKSDVTGVKYITDSSLEAYKFPYKSINKDPGFIGRMTPAKIKVCNNTASVVCCFSEVFREKRENLIRKPAIIENQLGKGHAWLVTAFDYPGSSGMSKLAENILRTILIGEQGDLRLLASDNIRYAVYKRKFNKYRIKIIYVLNTGFDLSQTIKVWLSGKISEEIIVAPSDMKIIYVVDSIILCPESRNCEIHSISESVNGLVIDFYNYAPQSLTIYNLSAKDMSVAINKYLAKIPLGGMCKVELATEINPLIHDFFTSDFLDEPEIQPANTSLPY